MCHKTVETINNYLTRLIQILIINTITKRAGFIKTFKITCIYKEKVKFLMLHMLKFSLLIRNDQKIYSWSQVWPKVFILILKET